MSSVSLGAKSASRHIRAVDLAVAGIVTLACIFLDTTQALAADSGADVMTTSALNSEFDTELARNILSAKVIKKRLDDYVAMVTEKSVDLDDDPSTVMPAP